MTVGEQIRYFRKEVLKMTQEEFAQKINISRSNLANIEIGKITLTDRVASDICNTFSLSETWLRTGEGEIYQDTDTTLFAAFAKRYGLTEEEQAVARYLLELSSEERQAVLQHVLGVAETIRAANFDRTASLPYKKRPPDHRMSTEEKRAIINAELDAEAKGKTSLASTRTSGTG